MHRPNVHRGFTLIELLVVVSIFAILAALLSAGMSQIIHFASHSVVNNPAMDTLWARRTGPRDDVITGHARTARAENAGQGMALMATAAADKAPPPQRPEVGRPGRRWRHLRPALSTTSPAPTSTTTSRRPETLGRA